jgi:hypothetical protein
MSEGSTPHVYKRSLGSRINSLLTFLGSLGLLVYFLTMDPEGTPKATIAILAALAFLSGFSTISNFGDRFVLDEQAITLHTLWSDLGLARSRRFHWNEVTELRAHRRRALFLHTEGRGTLVLDAVSGQDGLWKEVSLRTGLPLPKRSSPGEEERRFPD